MRGCYFQEKYPQYHITDKQAFENLEKIIEFKQQQPERVRLLLGNHDTHYFIFKSSVGTRYAIDLSIEYMELFSEHAHLFDYAFQLENILFTHAGVSRGWFEEIFRGDVSTNFTAQINERKEDDALYSEHRISTIVTAKEVPAVFG